jgi:hypothetical protein
VTVAPQDKQTIVAEIDRLINEMVKLRTRVASEISPPAMSTSKEWEIFGMWADREDMQGISTVEWLDKLRGEQWGPRDGRTA